MTFRIQERNNKTGKITIYTKEFTDIRRVTRYCEALEWFNKDLTVTFVEVEC